MIEIGRVNVDASEVEYTNNRMKLKINSGDFTRGSIQLTNNEIAWTKENTEEGFTIPWGKIVVTAISQDPQRCIYFMIDSKMFADEPANGNGNGDEHNEEDEEDEDEGVEAESVHEMTEFWLIPEDSNDIDNIYFFMSKYPAAGEMDDSEEDEEFFDGEDMEQMNINDDENDPRFAD